MYLVNVNHWLLEIDIWMINSISTESDLCHYLHGLVILINKIGY